MVMRPSVLLAAIVRARCRPGRRRRRESRLDAVARSPSRRAVVGSGPITWPQVAVRSQPSRTAPVLKTMTQFRPDFRPRVVLALSQRDDPKTGKPAWYRITIPGRPNGRTGWIPAGERHAEAGRPLARHLPRRPQVRVLRQRQGRSHRQGRRRREGDGDADRALLRAGEVRPVLGGARRLRLRDERLLEALGLARRRRRRRPRHEHAGADRTGRLARLRPPLQQGHPVPPLGRRRSERRSRSSPRRKSAPARRTDDPHEPIPCLDAQAPRSPPSRRSRSRPRPSRVSQAPPRPVVGAGTINVADARRAQRAERERARDRAG